MISAPTLDYWMSFDVRCRSCLELAPFKPAPFTVRTVPTIGEGETSYPALKSTYEHPFSPKKVRNLLAVSRTGVAVVEDRPGTERILGILENRRVPALGFRERRSWAHVQPRIRSQRSSDDGGSGMASAHELGQPA